MTVVDASAITELLLQTELGARVERRIASSKRSLESRSATASTEPMKRQRPTPLVAKAFDIVRAVGLALPDVEAATKYDGSPVLKVGGCFMAGLATDPSAEPGTIVVRSSFEEREWLLADAPDTYYLTDYHRKHPVVLVRLSRIDRDALRDLLSVSRSLTLAKAGRRVHRTRPTQRVGRVLSDPPNRRE